MTRELTYATWPTTNGYIGLRVEDADGVPVYIGYATTWRFIIGKANKVARIVANRALSPDYNLTPAIEPMHRKPWRPTRAFVVSAAKRHGFVARWSTEWSEWRITPRHLIVGETREGATYHTTDNQDAYDTIKAMSRQRREARLVVTPGDPPGWDMVDTSHD